MKHKTEWKKSLKKKKRWLFSIASIQQHLNSQFYSR